MGKFVYGANATVSFDDRTLAHLQAVIMAKVTRGEAFTFSWKNDMSTGGGRTGVYLHARSTLVFRYDSGHTVPLNRAWLQALTDTANSGTGLHLVPEPPVPAPATQGRGRRR